MNAYILERVIGHSNYLDYSRIVPETMHIEEYQRTCAHTVLKSSSLILELKSNINGDANQSREYFEFIIDTTNNIVRLQEVKKRFILQKTFWRWSQTDQNRSQPMNWPYLTCHYNQDVLCSL